MLVIFILMAIFTYRLKTGAEQGRKVAEEHSLQSLALMKERNEQERETQKVLSRMAGELSNIDGRLEHFLNHR